MKNILKSILLTFCLTVMMLACKDDEGPTPITSDFASLASTYKESDGTVTIPLRNATESSNSNLNIKFSGSATRGSDYELVGVTSEGVQIQIINDNLYEGVETIIIQIETNGNSIHTITVDCDGVDSGGWNVSDFAGDYDAVEDYGPGNTYGPYTVTFVQNEENPNRFDFDNFYDSGRDAYLIFDLTAGTVSFPDQTPLPDTTPNLLSGSSGTFDLCEKTLTVSLNYDGGDWVYRFTKQ